MRWTSWQSICHTSWNPQGKETAGNGPPISTHTHVQTPVCPGTQATYNNVKRDKTKKEENNQATLSTINHYWFTDAYLVLVFGFAGLRLKPGTHTGKHRPHHATLAHLQKPTGDTSDHFPSQTMGKPQVKLFVKWQVSPLDVPTMSSCLVKECSVSKIFMSRLIFSERFKDTLNVTKD